MGEQTSCTYNTIKKRLSLHPVFLWCLSWWCRWLQHCTAQGTWRLGSSEENPNLSAHHRKGLSSSWRRPSIINSMQRFYCFVRLIRAVAVHSHSKSMSEAASRPPLASSCWLYKKSPPAITHFDVLGFEPPTTASHSLFHLSFHREHLIGCNAFLSLHLRVGVQAPWRSWFLILDLSLPVVGRLRTRSARVLNSIPPLHRHPQSTLWH